MMDIISLLQALQENPDDISNIPTIIAKVQELQQAEGSYQTRIDDLQRVNRSLLAQVPIPTVERDTKPETDEEPTIEDATAYLIEKLSDN